MLSFDGLLGEHLIIVFTMNRPFQRCVDPADWPSGCRDSVGESQNDVGKLAYGNSVNKGLMRSSVEAC